MMKEQLIPLLAAALGVSPKGFERLNVFDSLPLAQSHGVSNLLYYALPYLPKEQQPEAAERQVLKEHAYAAAVREAVQQRELEALLARFEEEKIIVLPLKGSVIKYLYPKPAMRYMSDIDLLFDPAQAAQVRTIMEELGYVTDKYERGETDFYTSPTRMNYELHRSLRGEGFNESSRRFLDKLLSYAKPQHGREYVRALPNEEHYAYLLCHFVKHLINGGIGVRQVMDIYLCRRQWSFDEKRRDDLLRKLELTDFAATIEQLAYCWFGGCEGSAVTDELGAYILGSGAFGKDEQRIADRILKEQKKTSRVAYVIRRLFPSFHTMKNSFPKLKKAPILLPFYWFFRIFRGMLCRKEKLSDEMHTVLGTTKETVSERAAFYRRCGLKIYEER